MTEHDGASGARADPVRALRRRTGTLKGTATWVSVAAMAVFLWLVGHHPVGVTERASAVSPARTPTGTPATPPSTSVTVNPPPGVGDGGAGFFGGGGGYDFGTGGGPPVTSTGPS